MERFYTLRDYQVKAIAQLREACAQGHRAIVRQQPTGTGKSMEILDIALNAIEKKNEVWLLAPFPHLVTNLENYFLKMGIQPDIIQGNRKVKNPHPLVTIACVPTLYKRLKKYGKRKPFLILADECHHGTSETWDAVFNSYPDSLLFGYTATPKRLDGSGFDHMFSKLIPGEDIKWYIENGYLSDFRYIESPHAKNDPSDKTILAGELVQDWITHAEHYPTVVFAPTVEESKSIVEAYNEMARSHYGREIAVHIDASTPKALQDKIFDNFGTNVEIICNVNKIGEGIDLPSCKCVQLAAFTSSESRLIQWWGRCLRPLEGWTAVILDHVGLSSVHGYPDDHRAWELKGFIDPKKLLLHCYFCTEVIARDRRKVTKSSLLCPHCNNVNFFEREVRDGVETIRGSYAQDPEAQLIEVKQRSQTRQIQRILKQREDKGNKQFWAVYQSLVIPDLVIQDWMHLVTALGYNPNFAHKLCKIHNVLHTDITKVCYDKLSLAKVLGEAPNTYWATYRKIHNIDEEEILDAY